MLCNAALVASVWLMLMFVYDRYKALCSRLINSIPTKTTNYLDVHLKLMAVSLISIIFSIPRLFELTIVYHEAHGNYSIVLTRLIESPAYMLGYRVFGSLIFYSVIPYIIIFVMSWKIFLVLRAASKMREKMNVKNITSAMSSDSDYLIVALAVRFLVTRLPTIFLDILESLIGSASLLSSPVTMVYITISNLFIVFSSASTFFTMYVVSSKFRHTARDIFCTYRNVWINFSFD